MDHVCLCHESYLTPNGKCDPIAMAAKLVRKILHSARLTLYFVPWRCYWKASVESCPEVQLMTFCIIISRYLNNYLKERKEERRKTEASAFKSVRSLEKKEK